MSAGLLMYRRNGQQVEVFLVHPGGPFWAGKDAGAWSIPKGEFDAGEDPLVAARREFQEETGLIATGPFRPLREVQQKNGKRVLAWAFQGDGDPDSIQSNTFSLEWPPKSGRYAEFPEVDRAAWLNFEQARLRLNPGQVPLLAELEDVLKPV